MGDREGHGDGAAVIVTGAASGIGRAVACSLAAQGFAVTATDINSAGLAELLAEGRSSRWALETASMDVRDRESVAGVFHDVLAGVTHLASVVHCAGITWRGSMLEMPDSDYDSIIATNLTGSFVVLTAAARSLVAQGTPRPRPRWRFWSRPWRSRPGAPECASTR
jgi:NAD(P)-dependent dehydrogenase (short-subunit alcohol dehydrogenase family)